MYRRPSRKIFVGDIPVGGDSQITIQSMCNTKTNDIKSTVDQILQLEDVGCDIIRVAVNSRDDADSIQKIKEQIHIPLIVDIQYDYKLALYSAENNADALRLNPGNIGEKWKIQEVVSACRHHNIPIRVGVNSGSIKQQFLNQYHGVNEDSICYSALEQCEILESCGFHDIKVSLKASDVNLSIESYRKFSKLTDYPLHLGITESGPAFEGTVKSSVGIGTLLSEGIGDTIRVSLTADPIEEVIVAKQILKSLKLKTDGVNLISCPTCARTNIDLIQLVEEARARLKGIDADLTVALMGCPVNGPGEAKEADYGITGGDGRGLIFKKGEIIKTVNEDQLLDALIQMIQEELE